MLLLAAVVAHLLALEGECRRRATSNADGGYVYDYSRQGQDWTMASCASRTRQSPINFADVTFPPSGMTFAYAYEPLASAFHLQNNGHAYSLELAGLGVGGVTYEGAWYDLLTVNLHAESEHTFAGRHAPLELHLVHKRYDGNAVLIVAVPFDTAPNASAAGLDPVLQTFLKVPLPPPSTNAVVPEDEASPLALSGLLAESTFFEYAGSLSAPPCAEIATWLVRREPAPAAPAQVQALHAAVLAATGGFGNARATMPLNGRTVALRQAVAEDTVAAPAEAQDPPLPVPTVTAAEGREARAERWAEDALRIAKASADYVRDLDRRLHGAAEAHARALAPLLPDHAPGPAGGTASASFSAPAPSSLPAPVRAHSAADGAPTGAAANSEALSASMAAVAKEAVADAVRQMSSQVEAVAMKAAREAAQAAMQQMAAGGLPGQPSAPLAARQQMAAGGLPWQPSALSAGPLAAPLAVSPAAAPVAAPAASPMR